MLGPFGGWRIGIAWLNHLFEIAVDDARVGIHLLAPLVMRMIPNKPGIGGERLNYEPRGALR